MGYLSNLTASQLQAIADALAPVSVATGFSESWYALNTYALTAGQTQTQYRVDAVQAVSALQDADYALQTWAVLYGQAQAGYALQGLSAATGYAEASYAVLCGEAFSSWVVNLQTGAISEYRNWPFTSYAYDGRHLATAEDGIYVLEGDTDQGADIDALVDLGPRTFGTPNQKRLIAGYLGLRNDADMDVVLETDATTSTHTMSYAGDLALRKLLLPRGQVGNYHRVTLQNRDGADFELDSIELIPEVLSRRGTGRHQ